MQLHILELDPRFSAGDNSARPPGDICQCLETFLVFITGRKGPEMLLNTLLCTGPPTTKNYLAPDVSGGKIDKPYVRRVYVVCQHYDII